MKISTRVACLVASRCLVATPLVGTGQRKSKMAENKMAGVHASFAEIVRVVDCQKVPDLPRKY